MQRLQILWLKFSCYLTGYNFYILSNCSEISIRKVKKYASALLIVSILWSFIGYCFCERYIKLGSVGCVVGALISVIIIIQIERQILLADRANTWLKLTRVLIALLMAIVGSLIIDQIIFQDDIDKKKIESNQKYVNELMPKRNEEINKELARITRDLNIKENERKALLLDIDKHPNVQKTTVTIAKVAVQNTILDENKIPITKTVLKNSPSKITESIRNPKFDQLPLLDDQIKELNNRMAVQQNTLQKSKETLEKAVKIKTGFLDELSVMTNILKDSSVAMTVYLIWLSFLLILELLILIGKTNDKDSDYERTIQRQMEIHIRKIALLYPTA